MMAMPKMKERPAGKDSDDASVSIHVKAPSFDQLCKYEGGHTQRQSHLDRNRQKHAKKSRVSKLAADIQGVTGVDNQMTVEVP